MTESQPDYRITEFKPACNNCGNSPESSTQPFVKCKVRGAYFPRKWHCGKYYERPAKTEKKPNKTEIKP